MKLGSESPEKEVHQRRMVELVNKNRDVYRLSEAYSFVHLLHWNAFSKPLAEHDNTSTSQEEHQSASAMHSVLEDVLAATRFGSADTGADTSTQQEHASEHASEHTKVEDISSRGDYSKDPSKGDYRKDPSKEDYRKEPSKEDYCNDPSKVEFKDPSKGDYCKDPSKMESKDPSKEENKDASKEESNSKDHLKEDASCEGCAEECHRSTDRSTDRNTELTHGAHLAVKQTQRSISAPGTSGDEGDASTLAAAAGTERTDRLDVDAAVQSLSNDVTPRDLDLTHGNKDAVILQVAHIPFSNIQSFFLSSMSSAF